MNRQRVSFLAVRYWAAVTAVFAVLVSSGAALAYYAPSSTTPDLPGGPSLQFIGKETGSWESNPLMLLSGAQPLWGSVTSPELIFSGKTPTTQLSVDELVNENQFNQSNFNSTDVHSKVNFATQTQRWSFQFQQNTDYDTTRTSELFPNGFNNVISNIPVQHLGLTETPTISFAPDTTDKVSLTGSLLNSHYDNPIFTNYMQSSITPSSQHDFDPLNSGIFSVQAQQYKTTEGPSVTVNSVGPQIGWIGKLTPRFTAQVSAGVQGSDQYGAGVAQSQPWTLQYVYNADLAFKGTQDTTHFIASRADYPFGNGTESLLSTYSLTENHNLNELVSLNVGASYQAASYLSSSNGDLNYLLTGTGGLTYHATERLDISANYQYRYETIIGTNSTAQDNMATLSLTWHPYAWGL
jgi:hypothetical protein